MSELSCSVISLSKLFNQGLFAFPVKAKVIHLKTVGVCPHTLFCRLFYVSGLNFFSSRYLSMNVYLVIFSLTEKAISRAKFHTVLISSFLLWNWSSEIMNVDNVTCRVFLDIEINVDIYTFYFTQQEYKYRRQRSSWKALNVIEQGFLTFLLFSFSVSLLSSS